MRRPVGRRLATAVLALAVALPAGGAALACTTPVSFTRAARELPPDAAAAKNAVAWSAHAALGDALEAAGCDPRATGLQWLKAAAHAATPADVRRATGGLVAARARGDAAGYDAYLCGLLRVDGGFADAEQAEAARGAGLPCGALRVLGRRL